MIRGIYLPSELSENTDGAKKEGPDGAEPSFGSTDRVALADAVLSFPASERTCGNFPAQDLTYSRSYRARAR